MNPHAPDRRPSWLRRAGVVTVGAAALNLLAVSVALAHPGLRPDEVPAGATSTAELVVPHGCGAEGDEDPSATTQVALQWPEGIDVVPHEVDGWTTTVDERVTTWHDDGGATTDPVFLPVDVTVAADVAPGEVYASVHQECSNGESFRWQALPDEEGSPALRITVVAGSPGDDAGPPSTPTATGPTAAPSSAATPASTSAPTSDVTTPPATETPTATTGPTASPTVAAGDAGAGGGMPWWVPVVGVAVVLLAALPFVTRDPGPRGRDASSRGDSGNP